MANSASIQDVESLVKQAHTAGITATASPHWRDTRLQRQPIHSGMAHAPGSAETRARPASLNRGRPNGGGPKFFGRRGAEYSAHAGLKGQLSAVLRDQLQGELK